MRKIHPFPFGFAAQPWPITASITQIWVRCQKISLIFGIPEIDLPGRTPLQ
jgi:hypothetical protein